MIEFARAQAAAQNVSNRMQFHTMDALRILEFPDNSFNLINQRFATSYLRTWDWSKLLQEYQRISIPDGIIRVTEFDFVSGTTSPAHQRLLGSDA